MGNFNRGNSSGRDRNFNKRDFGNREFNRPVEMHKATCGKCGRDCEVPFRPTNSRPVFCSSCFENNRNSDSSRLESRNSGRSTSFEERLTFEAVCDECGNNCNVPFKPSHDKPIYCSNCFGEKKGAGKQENGQHMVQYRGDFEQLNNKLDKILTMLAPEVPVQVVQEDVIKEVKVQPSDDQTISTINKTKVARKKPSKK